MKRVERTYYQKDLKVVKALEERCEAANAYFHCKDHHNCYNCICADMKDRFTRNNPLYKKEEENK